MIFSDIFSLLFFAICALLGLGIFCWVAFCWFLAVIYGFAGFMHWLRPPKWLTDSFKFIGLAWLLGQIFGSCQPRQHFDK